VFSAPPNAGRPLPGDQPPSTPAAVSRSTARRLLKSECICFRVQSEGDRAHSPANPRGANDNFASKLPARKCSPLEMHPISCIMTHQRIFGPKPRYPRYRLSVIELNGVAKTFGGTVHALRGVSFSVPTGSVCALLGHNGAGKTTTIKILSTLLRPTSGQAFVAGHDVVRHPAQVRASIGTTLTGQFAALDMQLTGRENLVFFGRLHGMRRSHARLRADDLIHQFDMSHAADRKVCTYSNGMWRRIDIASALMVPPKVLFLDEPSTGLDPRSRRDVWALVSSLSAQGITVLLTTQYLDEADALSDSIVVIDAGRVIASGTAEDLKRRAGFSYCTVSPVDPADLSRIFGAVADLDGAEADHGANTVSVRALDGVKTFSEVFRRIDQLGVELLDISLRKPTLDEAFLHLTLPTVTT
jgi:ABC-2 type transport system ATP-binding protein